MSYINPYELLGINSTNLSDIDSKTVLKEKRKLLQEIELSDTDSVIHNGIELTKADCLTAVDDLDDRNKREFHFFIFQNRPLNDFLSKGSLLFFEKYQVESIYKLPEFLDFVSPYFAPQYDKILTANFKNRNIKDVSKILSVKPITNGLLFESCYKGTYSTIKNIDTEIKGITKDVELKQSAFINNNFIGLDSLIKEKIHVDVINLLPAYFQSLRNQLAQSIRNLARDINNEPYNLYEPAYRIIEIANSISTDGLVKQTITKGYYTIKKNYEDDLPKQPKLTPQPTQTYIAPSTQVKEDSEEDVDDKFQEKETKYKSNNFYKGFLAAMCAVLIWALYNSTVKTVLLSITLTLSIVQAYNFIKKPEEFIKNKKIDKFVFITSLLVCIGAFFYKELAVLYIFFNLLIWGHTLFADVVLNKPYRNNRSIAYLIIAIIGTYFYSGNGDTLFAKRTNESSLAETEQVLTDKDYFAKGQSLFNNSNFTDAISQYTQAININPNYVDAYIDRGASKANIGQYDAAIKDYKKAEELGFNKALLYSNLGFAYYKLNQPDSAKIYLGKALIIDPSNANAYRWRGEIKYDENDNAGAVSDYSLAIKYNPNASNYFARGLAYYYLKNYRKAVEDMDKGIELNPNASQYYFDRGDAKELLKDYDGACRDWKTAKLKGYDVPEYKINKCTPQIVYLPNGELSGCNAILSKYNRSLNNKLIITVGNNASVAVKMIDISTKRCIRYVFINKNTTYTIKNIPEGKYYLKIAYGEDWSIMEGQSNCTGRFSRNPLFEKGDEILDYNLVHSRDGFQVPSFSLKLDVIMAEDKINSFNTDKINETDFYNN